MRKLSEGLYKLEIPFEELYTSVFIVNTEEGTAVIDAATYPEDVDRYILPALKELEIGKIDVLLLTHSHGDHAGGAGQLCKIFPEMKVRAAEALSYPNFELLTDGETFLGRIRAVHLPGHTAYATAYRDLASGILLTGDCLQLKGVGKYIHGVEDVETYLQSVEKVRGMDITGIAASHDYVPLGSTAFGREEIERYLNECARAMEEYVPI